MGPQISKFLRWFRVIIKSKWTAFLLASVIICIFLLLQRPDNLTGESSSIFVVGLVNINLILIIALAFAAGRNLVKLFLDRRSKVLGSKLRQRLVIAFLVLTLIPTVIMFILASGLINRATSGWFSAQVETIVNSSIDVARLHLDSKKEEVGDTAAEIASLLENNPLVTEDITFLEKLISDLRKKYSLYNVSIFTTEGVVYYQDKNVLSEIEEFSEPKIDQDLLKSVLTKESQVMFEEKNANKFIRSYSKIKIRDFDGILLVTKLLDQELTAHIQAVQDSYKEYGQLKLFKSPLKTSYLLTLALITGVIIFAAIWLGLYLAREIATPLQRISEGTRAIARGDYDFHLKVSGDDEISELGRSFNKMVDDIKESRNEIENRRLYTETILDNLAVGVIGLDSRHKTTAINAAAVSLFAFKSVNNLLGKNLTEVFSDEGFKDLNQYFSEVIQTKTHVEKEIAVYVNGQEKRIIVTSGEVDADDESLGLVLLFDDVTELVKAQQISAWREVAKRLAHEIKNPLTPIKLAAQRIQKNLGNLEQDQIVAATETIVENTDSIKVMVNEFSDYARLPVAEFKRGDLNKVIADIIQPYVEENEEIVFQFIQAIDLPEIDLDISQINRCIINLLDNAVAAIQESSTKAPKIIIKTIYKPDKDLVAIEITDNGPGIKSDDKSHIFEPYFTTKKSGTGLGLAMVSSIVSDHKGRVRVFSNQPQGAQFVIELPVNSEGGTQRRFG